ncbi:MAG: hypothetical protein AABY22_26015 [Nanoarchaeota archaeon]
MKNNIGLLVWREALFELLLVERSINNACSQIKILFIKAFLNAPTLKKGEWMENRFTRFARVYTDDESYSSI